MRRVERPRMPPPSRERIFRGLLRADGVVGDASVVVDGSSTIGVCG